jgi:hypothetical protein
MVAVEETEVVYQNVVLAIEAVVAAVVEEVAVALEIEVEEVEAVEVVVALETEEEEAVVEVVVEVVVAEVVAEEEEDLPNILSKNIVMRVSLLREEEDVMLKNCWSH